MSDLSCLESGLGARTRGRNGSCACEVPKKTRDQVTKQSVVESLREFSCMFPPNMIVIVFCTSPDSMYSGNLTRTILSEGDSPRGQRTRPCRPNLAEKKTRIWTSSGAEGGSLGAVWREVSQLHPLGALVGETSVRCVVGRN